MDPRPWASTTRQRTPNWRNSIVTFPRLQNVILGMACVTQAATHNLSPTASQGLPEAAFQAAYVRDMAAAPIEGTMKRCDDRLQYVAKRRRLDTPKGAWT
jgi:hypothetical protein